MGFNCLKCLKACFCCPILLPFYACKIYCCGCLYIFFATLWQMLAHCCCACWACLCCACCGCEAQFRDKEFPPDNTSLGRDEKNVEWVRLDEFFTRQQDTKAQLFQGAIEPGDVSQGGLGDCWLMSSIAALAENPTMIRRMFVTKRYSPYGKYTIRLFDAQQKKWVHVTVDNFIPVKRKGKEMKPVYADMHNNEMWAVLVEKAIAKFCRSFANIEGGSTTWALHTLTGFPTFALRKKDDGWRRFNFKIKEDTDDKRAMGLMSTDEKYSVEDLFYIIKAYDEARAIMCCSSTSGKDTETSPQGIVQGHAYTLLGAKKVGDVLLVQVRNPWGCGEWKGDWSDKSPLWKKNPKIAKECNHTDADDGAFWMTIQDFVQQFRAVTICAVNTGFDELELDPHEDLCCCGLTVGCCTGCCCFWCGCRGCKALCCGEEGTDKTREAKRDDGCCA